MQCVGDNKGGKARLTCRRSPSSRGFQAMGSTTMGSTAAAAEARVGLGSAAAADAFMSQTPKAGASLTQTLACKTSLQQRAQYSRVLLQGDRADRAEQVSSRGKGKHERVLSEFIRANRQAGPTKHSTHGTTPHTTHHTPRTTHHYVHNWCRHRHPRDCVVRGGTPSLGVLPSPPAPLLRLQFPS